VVPAGADPTTGSGVYNIALNSEVNLALVVNTPFFNPGGIALDGAVVWAEDSAGNRIGEWAGHPNTMTPWAVCNLVGNNPLVGIVHQQLVTCNPSITGFTYKAPPTLVGSTITFKGVGVTDDGYGTFSSVFQVTALQFNSVPGNLRPFAANTLFKGAALVNNGAFMGPAGITTHQIQGNVHQKDTLRNTTSTSAIIGGALVGAVMGGMVMGFALWVSRRIPLKKPAVDPSRMMTAI